MRCAALIWSKMQRKCVASVYIVFWLGVSLHFSYRNQSARLVQARVKSSNLEH